MIVAKESLNGKIIDKQLIQGKINKTTEYIEVYPEIQSKTITPTKQIQTILPDENIYALSQVTVNPIPNNYIEPQGQKEITENGTTDVSQYASANVNVPTPAPNLQNKSITITENGTNTITADTGYDGLDEVEITTNVSGAKAYPPDWSEIGYDNTPENIIDSFNYSKEIKNTWDNNVINLRNKFYNNKNLVYMPLVDTSKVTNMNGMFNSCTSLISVPLLDTSTVTDMGGMFRSCTSLINIAQLDTSTVTDMAGMFRGCSSLINIPQLNTSNVTTTANMFQDCIKLTVIPLLDTSKVTNIGYMFNSCTSLISVPLLDTNRVTYMNNMFSNCYNLSNESLNNILQMCINAISYTSTKTLSRIGISQTQASICTSLSNYQAFLDAGWTTGY